MTLDLKVNDAIEAKNVRLVTDEGSSVIPLRNALRIARDQDLDLVEVNDRGSVPVCKIMDYGKYKYELSKREKELARKNRESQIDMKEIQLRPVTDLNDIKTKALQCQKFIDKGNKVKVAVRFRGREMSHMAIGNEVFDKFLSFVENYKFDKEISVSGREMSIIIMKASDEGK